MQSRVSCAGLYYKIGPSLASDRLRQGYAESAGALAKVEDPAYRAVGDSRRISYELQSERSTWLPAGHSHGRHARRRFTVIRAAVGRAGAAAAGLRRASVPAAVRARADVQVAEAIELRQDRR